MLRTAGEVELLLSGFPTPEGPAFDRDGILCFVDWEASSIVALTPEGVAGELFNTKGIPAGLAFHPDGSLWIADEGENIHGLLRIGRDGESTVVVNEYEGEPLNGANDLVFDAEGVVYFSDPWGSSADHPIGAFYRYFPEGRLEQIDSGLAFPNGVAVSADGIYVYLAETFRNRILRYPINGDGTVGPREHFADTEEPSGPDGMAFDANGDLYVAHWDGGRVDIFNQEGRQIDEIRVPGIKPTNVAFGGSENKDLVITEVETGSLYRVRMNVAGQPLHDGRSHFSR
jgi:gluconolactonase